MPISGKHAHPTFGEKFLIAPQFNVLASDDLAHPVNELAQSIKITEVGILCGSFTGTSIDMDVFQANDLNHNILDPTLTIGTGAGEITNVMDPGPGFQLTAVGTVMYRPNGGIIVTSDYKESVNSPPRQIIQLQVRATLTGITAAIGAFWIKYIILQGA